MSSLKINNGFTLTEVMISLLLLAIILVGGIKLYNYSQMIMVQAMHKKIVTEAANDEMEEIKKDLAAYKTMDEIRTGYPKQKQVGDLMITLLAPERAAYNEYNKVDLTLVWGETGKTDNKNLTLTMPVN